MYVVELAEFAKVDPGFFRFVQSDAEAESRSTLTKRSFVRNGGFFRQVLNIDLRGFLRWA